jgi:hypothetical protein
MPIGLDLLGSYHRYARTRHRRPPYARTDNGCNYRQY